AISGTGSVTKQNVGTLIVKGPNNYSGGTTVSGGILQGDTTSLIGNITNNGAVVFDQAIDGTYAGTISGSGSVTKQNTGTLTIRGVNTYTGKTIVTGGKLVGNTTYLQADIIDDGEVVFNQTTSGKYAGVLSGSGKLTKLGPETLIVTGDNTYTGGTLVGEGTLQGDTTSLKGDIINNAAVVFNQVSEGTYAGVLSGSGKLTKIGSGTLIVTGENTHTGGTTVNSGTLQGDTKSLPGDIINNAAVVFNQASNATYAGTISGSGDVIKQGAGTLVVTEMSSYKGKTTVSAGALQGNTTTLPGKIVNNSIVVFDQVNDGTYAGVISGTGSINKQEAGTLNFINDSSAFSAGTVNINEGTVLVNGKLGGTIIVNLNTMLGGKGSVIGNGINYGRVSPGNSIDTLSISGGYTQEASGELYIEIAPAGATDLLQVGGVSTLNGNLLVGPSPGIYRKGKTYIFLTSGAGVTGTFSSSFSEAPIDYKVSYFPNFAQICILSTSYVAPPRPSGNAGAVADYLFCTPSGRGLTPAKVVTGPNARLCPPATGPASEFEKILEALFSLSPSEYAKALTRLSPSQFGALALNEVENNFQLANTFFTKQRACCYENDCGSTDVWLNPLGFVYSQGSRPEIGQEGIGFTNHTYGFTIGVDRVFRDNWSLGAGAGFSHSQLDWKEEAGKASASSGYLGPCLKYNSENFYFDFLILGTGSFYDVHRKIEFPGVSLEADSSPAVWNISETILAGVRLERFCNFFLQPEILLDQLNIFQEGFKEDKARAVNLSVKRKYASFLRSLANIKFAKEWFYCDLCLMPSVNVGWLRTTPLSGSHYTANFREGKFCSSNFSVTSFHQITDQVLVGAQFCVSSQNGFSFSLGYDGKFGSGSKVSQVNMTLDWKF
ncbi:MAG: autotransporter-associated beta strand repeat-containing protein, partial [Candidatus Rhabdochlamydia sp.]